MRQAWRGVFRRLRTLLVAALTGSATQVPQVSHAAVSPSEQAAWDRARSSGSAAAFQRYLELFPTGQYAEEAFRILVEKSWRAPSRATPSPAVPDPLELSTAQVIVAAQSVY